MKRGLWPPCVEAQIAATFPIKEIINIGVESLCLDTAKVLSLVVRNGRPLSMRPVLNARPLLRY